MKLIKIMLFLNLGAMILYPSDDDIFSPRSAKTEALEEKLNQTNRPNMRPIILVVTEQKVAGDDDNDTSEIHSFKGLSSVRNSPLSSRRDSPIKCCNISNFSSARSEANPLTTFASTHSLVRKEHHLSPQKEMTPLLLDTNQGSLRSANTKLEQKKDMAEPQVNFRVSDDHQLKRAEQENIARLATIHMQKNCQRVEFLMQKKSSKGFAEDEDGIIEHVISHDEIAQEDMFSDELTGPAPSMSDEIANI